MLINELQLAACIICTWLSGLKTRCLRTYLAVVNSMLLLAHSSETGPQSLYPLFRKVGRLKQGVCDMQRYITEMGRCLLSTGQDMDSAAGKRLRQLFTEFWCLYSVKARVASREWRKLVDSPFLADSPDATMALPPPDWANLKVGKK